MTNTSPPKPQRKLTSLELSAPARGALRRFKHLHGISFTYAVERGLALLEKEFTIGEPMPPADRAKLGLPSLAAINRLDRLDRRNRRKGASL